MVLLKTILLSLLMALSVLINAQDVKLTEAFTESLNLEAQLKYVEAVEVLKPMLTPDNYEVALRLGWLYYNSGKYSEADMCYTLASKIMPYAIEAKLGATLPKSMLNDWDGVIQMYSDVLAIDSKNSTALYNLGLIYYNLGQFPMAYEKFMELNNLYPTDYNALLMHAWSGLQLGKNREAKVLFKKLLLLYPGDESALKGLEGL